MVIVHRVNTVMSEDPKTIQTKGDANPCSMEGTDYPITEKVYIGKVEYVITQIGYITQILQPPINYIIIAVIIGIMVVKQLSKKKRVIFQNTRDETDDDQPKLDNIDDIKLDSEYVNESDPLDDPSKNMKDDSEEK